MNELLNYEDDEKEEDVGSKEMFPGCQNHDDDPRVLAKDQKL